MSPVEKPTQADRESRKVATGTGAEGSLAALLKDFEKSVLSADFMRPRGPRSGMPAAWEAEKRKVEALRQRILAADQASRTTTTEGQAAKALAAVEGSWGVTKQRFVCNGQTMKDGDGNAEFFAVADVEAAWSARLEALRAILATPPATPAGGGEAIREAAENLLIGIGMGWDLEGLTDALQAALSPSPADAPVTIDPDDLRPWGWAPGSYVFKCIDCPDDLDMYEKLGRLGDKRSRRCEEHAKAARAALDLPAQATEVGK